MPSESSASPKWRYSATAREQMKALGLPTSVDEMLDHAAIVSHPAGNRRFHGLVFRVKAGEVLSVVSTEESFVVWEECPVCAGSKDKKGCDTCGGVGEIKICRKVSSTVH